MPPDPSPAEPERAATILSLKLFRAALVLVISLAGGLLALLLADSGLANLLHARGAANYIAAALFLPGSAAVLLISALILVPALAELRLAILLETRGETTEGVILEKRLETDRKGNQYSTIVFTFAVGVHLKQGVPAVVYPRLAEGGRVLVRYLAASPTTARLESLDA